MTAILRPLVLWALTALMIVPFAFGAPAGSSLGADAVARIARDWLIERLGSDVDPHAVELAGPPRELALPAGEVTFNTTQQSGSIATGSITVLVEAIVTDARGARTTRSTTVNFRVNQLHDVVVTVRELGRRAIVGASDVRLERRPITKLPANAIRDLREVVGHEVTRPLAPGEVVTAQAVTAPMVIRRGSVVAVIVEGANFRIVARGVASEDGALGAPIRVLNAASRKEVVGRVEDERTVRIPF